MKCSCITYNNNISNANIIMVQLKCVDSTVCRVMLTVVLLVLYVGIGECLTLHNMLRVMAKDYICIKQCDL